jgi:hypothetical protein
MTQTPEAQRLRRRTPCSHVRKDDAMAEGRKYIDCREVPSESRCSLKISGTEEEVLKAAREHAISSHGHKDSPELATQLRAGLRDDRSA